LRPPTNLLSLASPLLLALLLIGPTNAPGAEPTKGAEAPSSVPSPDATALELMPVAVPEPSALAIQFHRTGNWIWALGVVWSLLVPALLLGTGISARIRDVAQRMGRTWYFTVGLYVVLWSILMYAINLPLHFYRGYIRLHAYGLSNQTFAKWLTDSLKHAAVSAVVGAMLAWVPYLLIRRSPRRWWSITTVLSIPFLFSVVLLKPIWVDPLFNDYGAMKDKVLEREILALAERAGISGSRVYEVDMSVDTKLVNAQVTGLLGTKRIVLWDTLLDRLDHQEVLAVMGHEMGHYVLGHIPRSILLSTLITLAGLFFVDRAGRWILARAHGRFGFDQLSDVASVPLLLLLMQLSSLALVPIVNAYSRHQEHEADRFALEVTRSNREAAEAFVKLQEENLAVPWPGWVYRVWRASHPSIGERIEFCNSYRPWATGQPLRYSRWIHR